MPNLAISSKCTGCSACVAVCPNGCIQMQPDLEGFLHPIIDPTACIECGLCERTCPVLHTSPLPKGETEAYAAICEDDSIRMESTSGGIFSLLAQWVLGQGGVVFGAAYQEDFSVAHCAVTNIGDLNKLRTAKYAQSVLGDTFMQVKSKLKAGQYVLFSGTPCQTAGLQAYLKTPMEKLILVDVICHGVPSPKVWQAYLEYRQQQDAPASQIKNINLRSKETGWPNYSIRFSYEDGTVYSVPNHQDSFLQGFIGDFYLRPACYTCSFKGIHRCTDFTLADYWGIEDQLPQMNDGKGTSLVFIHSQKARCIWSQLQKRCQQVDPMQSVEKNQSALFPSHMPSNRNVFWKCYRMEDFSSLVSKLLTPRRASFVRRCIGKIKKQLFPNMRYE